MVVVEKIYGLIGEGSLCLEWPLREGLLYSGFDIVLLLLRTNTKMPCMFRGLIFKPIFLSYLVDISIYGKSQPELDFGHARIYH